MKQLNLDATRKSSQPRNNRRRKYLTGTIPPPAFSPQFMYLDVPFPHRPSHSVSGPLIHCASTFPCSDLLFSLISSFFSYSDLFILSLPCIFVLNIFLAAPCCTATDVLIADLCPRFDIPRGELPETHPYNRCKSWAIDP